MRDSKNKEDADSLYRETFNKHVNYYGEDKARQIAQQAVREYWTGEAEGPDDETADF